MYINDGLKRDLMHVGAVLLLLLIVFVAWILGNTTMKPALARAEALCEEHPDKALATLDSIPPRWWWHPERRARLGLFRCRSLDKSFVDQQSDSLLQPALDYYRIAGDPRYRMLTYFHWGRILQNANRHAEAYASYAFADHLADSLQDFHQGGLIARSIAEIHNYSNNFTEELYYAEKALKRFGEAGSDLHTSWAHYDLAHAQANNKIYDLAIENYAAFARSALSRGDTVAVAHSLTDQAASYLSLGKAAEAKEILELSHTKYGYPKNVKWLSDYACACARTGETERALRCIREAEAQISDPASRMRVMGRKAQIEAARGAFESAYDTEQIVSQLVDSTVRVSLEQSVVSFHRDQYRREAERLSQRLKTRTGSLVWIILIVVSLSGGTVGWLTIRNRMREREIENYIAQIVSIRDNLLNQEAAVTELGVEIEAQFRERFLVINRLAETYYTHRDTSKEKQKIYQSILDNLTAYGSPEFVRRELEPMINRTQNGIIERMRSQLPILTEGEIQLVCYLLTGFSTGAISLFLQTNPDNVYRKRYRLRERIKKSEAPDKADFLAKLA